MSASRPRASIIIRCLNEAEHIGHLLDLLAEQKERDVEIIVVDSGSTDGTLEIAEARDEVRLLHIAKEDFSFGRSLNVGCRAARGEFLVNVSAHCYPEDELWLTNLLEWFDDPKTAGVYGRQRGHASSHFSELRIFEKWFPESSIRQQRGPFCNNANCAVRRELWERHPYDEQLPGLEDIAWAKEVIAEGYHMAYRADAGVIHVHDETRKQTRNRYRREAIALQTLDANEHFNLVDFVRLLTTNVVADLRRAAREQVLLDEFRGVLEFRVAQFWGAYEGFRTRWPASSSLKRHLYYPEAD